MPYTLRSAPVLSTLEDVRKWVEDELGYIEQAQHDSKLVQIQPSFRDVDKPRDGMIVYADGVNFNPGGGAGTYEYRSGAWHKLADDIDVVELETDITDLENAVATNTTNIATNTANIATNTAALVGPTEHIGFSNGSNAPAGDVGEYKSTIVASGSAVAMTANTDTQIASLALTAGDWDLSGELFCTPSGTMTALLAAINTSVTAAAGAPADGVDEGRLRGISSGALTTINGLRTRVNISSPATYLLVAVSVGSAATGYGALRARRMR